MFSLQDLLGQEQGNQAVEQISQNVGADSSAVNSAIQVALPMILNGIASNASTPQGAQSLDTALARDHDGSLLNNLGGLGDMIFGSQQAAPPKEADAGGILGHIFGTNQGQVAQEVSNQTGLGMGQVAQILMMLAPSRSSSRALGPTLLGGCSADCLGVFSISNSPQGMQ